MSETHIEIHPGTGYSVIVNGKHIWSDHRDACGYPIGFTTEQEAWDEYERWEAQNV